MPRAHAPWEGGGTAAAHLSPEAAPRPERRSAKASRGGRSAGPRRGLMAPDHIRKQHRPQQTGLDQQALPGREKRTEKVLEHKRQNRDSDCLKM